MRVTVKKWGNGASAVIAPRAEPKQSPARERFGAARLTIMKRRHGPDKSLRVLEGDHAAALGGPRHSTCR